MPTYQVRCKECNKIFDAFVKIEDRYKIKCECGGDAKVWFGGLTTVAAHVWTPYWEENICHQPVLVESKKHLKELCKEHDVIAHRLD